MKKNYENPLIVRYSSKEMSEVFSPDSKFTTWRKLWVALAESQKELGLNITDKQINELRNKIYDIDYNKAKKMERKFRHDVMAHVHTYGEQCPNAKGIIHLGATSAFIGDNTDIILIKNAMQIVKSKLINLIDKMTNFSLKYKSLPTLGYTHYQPAQMTTVGKRASLWLYDIYLDYKKIESTINNIKFRGVKGTTGTQASFLNLFSDDHDKVKQLDKLVAEKMGFDNIHPVSGQTYTRKQDFDVLSSLSSIAQSLHKITNDIRLLQSMKEVEEPFGKSQIGSSAMAYKRNPMRCERVASLSKYIISNLMNPALIHSTQWFERTLDDSANRRLSIAQGFLATDAILDIAINIFDGLHVYKNVIKANIDRELPFMATENILMESVKRGGDRQELHESIRILSMKAAKEVKEMGKENNLINKIKDSDLFPLTEEEIDKIVDPKNFVGRSEKQVEEFIEQFVRPILEKNKNILGIDVNLKV